MLKDAVRTRAYQTAIERNPHLVRGKIVLDVGCGTGILSLFAARAGAKHVYGVECSAIAVQAQQIVADNGYGDRVTILHGKLEDITLPVPSVDVIISEWMGYCLLYESMLDTVLAARDRWLAPGGVLLPDRATLRLCAIEDAEYRADKLDFWDDVYGFDFGAIKAIASAEPLVDTVDAAQVVTDDVAVAAFDLTTMTKADATFSVPFKLTAARTDYVHALVAHFDVAFTACHTRVGFGTGPAARPTHWKQTVFYLGDALAVTDGDVVAGTLACAPNEGNPRDLDIDVTYEHEGTHGAVRAEQKFRMR